MKNEKMTKVKTADLLDALDSQSDQIETFINLKTGEICFIDEEVVNIVEDNRDDYPEWQKEDVDTVKHYLENPDDYLGLPSQYEINEYQMMEDFSSTLENEKITGQLLITLQGQGAFRRFKDSVKFLGIETEWYKFRDERYRQFITEWCKDNEITMEE